MEKFNYKYPLGNSYRFRWGPPWLRRLGFKIDKTAKTTSDLPYPVIADEAGGLGDGYEASDIIEVEADATPEEPPPPLES